MKKIQSNDTATLAFTTSFLFHDHSNFFCKSNFIQYFENLLKPNLWNLKLSRDYVGPPNLATPR